MDPGREPRFSDLAKFVDEKSRVASSMFGVDLTKENSQSNHDRATPGKNQNNGAKVTTLAANSKGEVKTERKCICCSGTCLDVASCERFEAMGINTATQPKVSCVATNTCFSKSCLGIVPVVVKGENGNNSSKYALLDDGADKSSCDERLINALHVASRPVTFKISTVSSTGNTIYGQEVDLHVQPVNGEDTVSLRNIWSAKWLPVSTQSAAVNDDIKNVAYLADIDVPNIDTM